MPNAPVCSGDIKLLNRLVEDDDRMAIQKFETEISRQESEKSFSDKKSRMRSSAGTLRGMFSIHDDLPSRILVNTGVRPIG